MENTSVISPTVTNLATNHLLQVLRQFANWVHWKYELVDGHWKKPPYQLRTGRKAWTTVPAHWCPYADWFAGAFKLGFVLSKSCNLICIDLDNKTNDSALYDRHRRILEDFQDTYIEYSPSGNGVHIWCLGTLDKNGYKFSELGIELYCNVRFMTVTFNPVPNGNNPLTDGTERCAKWIAELSPPDRHTVTPATPAVVTPFPLRRIFDKPTTTANATTGNGVAKFPTGFGGGVGGGPRPNIHDLRCQPLTISDVNIQRSFIARPEYQTCTNLFNGNWQGYSTQSEADQALCNVIAYYTDDPVQVARLFMHSRLADTISRHQPQYLWRTIDTAFDLKGGA